MASRPARVLSCFSGVGSLDLAHRLVFPDARVVCYIEREIPAVAGLAARMADGSLHPAPVWSDVRTVPDVVRAEWVVGGFPCQDLSSAGKRGGIGGARSGLFYAMLDAAERCGARYLFLENVRGILSADGVDGEVDADGMGDGADAVRAIASVSWALADGGFDAEWVCLRASAVGAPHGRDRWFCLAWRVADASSARHGEPEVGGADRGDARDWPRRGEPERGCPEVADPEGEDGRGELQEGRAWRGRAGSTRDGANMADPRVPGRQGRERERHALDGSTPECRGALADPERDGLHRIAERDIDEAQGLGASRRDDADRRGADLPLFPPGPGEWADGGGGRMLPLDRDAARWVEVLAERPDLAPAVEPGVRGVAHGVADRVVRLRGAGNGVVVLQGAVALRLLCRRAGVTP